MYLMRIGPPFQAERGGQWVKGKSAETSNPAGPWLVTPDEVEDDMALDLWPRPAAPAGPGSPVSRG